MVCLALELVGSWVELGFSVWRLLDEILSIKVAWNQELSGVLVFSSFGFKPLVFSLILIVASRISPSIPH